MRPKNKNEFRKELAEKFIEALETKGLYWRQEWNGFNGEMPYNGVTKKHYSGVNVFNLALVSMFRGYSDPRWVTMVQIMDKKATYHPNEKWHLQKGAKATYVEYWFPYDVIEKKAVTWERFNEVIKEGRHPKEFVLSTKYTAVFNASLVEGMPALEKPPQRDINGSEIIDKLSTNMGVPIMFDGGNRAYYSPHSDQIHLPEKGYFFSEEAFNSTALHELAHSTGHHDRLNRNLLNGFGSPDYAYEELVAEITSCFMLFNTDTEFTEDHVRNHQAYVASWIEKVRNEPDALVKAIKMAEDAANYMEFQAELVTEAEYNKLKGKSFVIENDNLSSIKKEEQTEIVEEDGPDPADNL